MEQKKLEEFIGEYAEFVYHTDPGADSRRDPCSDNPSAMLMITKIKPRVTTCGDCAKVCDKPIDRWALWDFKKSVWNVRCLACKRSLNHTTGKFEYAAKKSNIRPIDPVTKKFLKEHFGDQATADAEQQTNDVNQG
jgi:hypothetical protein